MNTRRRNTLLEKLNDLPEDQSGSDYDGDLEDSQEELEDAISTDSSDGDVVDEDDIQISQAEKLPDDHLDKKPRVAYEETVHVEQPEDDNWEFIEPGVDVGRPAIHTIFRDASGPTGYAKRNIMVGFALTALQLLIDYTMIEHIRICTEAEACRVLGVNWTVSRAEILAFIGILYARGAYEARNLGISYLWSLEWGPDFFRKAMSRNRFSEILRYLRFDKKEDRPSRLLNDKFAMISYIWRNFIDNCQLAYKPGSNITIDEQLFPTKARCRFTQFIPTKPGKFGIKFWLAADVDTKYLINGFPYLGKDEKRAKDIPLGQFVVQKLIEPYLDQGRTVITDNYFTSVRLAHELMDRNTSLVGTVRSDRKDLPSNIRTKKDKMSRFSTEVYKRKNVTLTVYKSKPQKKVILLSTRHRNVQIDRDTVKKVPSTIKFYNNTKYGVDVLDQMARKCSVKGKARRWPLQVFFNILDLAGVNAWILYTETTGDKISRKDFLFKLAKELTNTQNDLSSDDLSMIFQEIDSGDASATSPVQRKSCEIGLCRGDGSNEIPKAFRNKTTTQCIKCNKYVCGKCTKKDYIMCMKCKK